MDIVLRNTGSGTVLDWGAGSVRCVVGRGGVGDKYREGDGITPRGKFPLRRVFYRADRMAKPNTMLPVQAIAEDDGWCDGADDTNYNQPVKLPYPASAENLWREDHVYDLIVVVGYNDNPVVPGKGSAIFLHLVRPDFSPTEGCVALVPADLLAIVAQLKPGDCLSIP